MAWYKMDDAMHNDIKWPVVARLARRKVGAVVSVWVAILGHASQSADRGSLDGFDCEMIDALFGYREGDCAAIVAAMEAKGLIADGRVAGWEKWQPNIGEAQSAMDAAKPESQQGRRPLTGSERQRRYLERKKALDMTKNDAGNDENDGAMTKNDAPLTENDANDAGNDENDGAMTKNDAPMTENDANDSGNDENDGAMTKNDAPMTNSGPLNKAEEIKIKIKNKIQDKGIKKQKACAEAADGAPALEHPPGSLPALFEPGGKPDPCVIELPIAGERDMRGEPMQGARFRVFQSHVDRWAALYPAVDVPQQLRAMLGWIEAHPARRKTRRGVLGFVNSWLARAQDRGAWNCRASPPQPGAGRPSAPTEHQRRQQENREMAAMILRHRSEERENAGRDSFAIAGNG